MTKLTLDKFIKEEWPEKAGITSELSPLEKGRRFALHLFMDYYEVSDEEDINHLDGSGDGGIFLISNDLYSSFIVP